MAQWFRSWHGAPTDTKWLAVARRANVVPGIVSAIVWALFDHASQADARGNVEGFDVEAYAAFSGFEEHDIEAVMNALRDKGIVTGDTLSAWEKRQPKREDDSGERVKRYRQKAKADNDAKRDVTQRNAPDTEQKQNRIEQKDARAVDYDRLEGELREAAGLADNPSPGLCDLSPILNLQKAGYDLRTDILPKLREAKAKGATPRSWSYFVPAITDAHRKNAVPDKPQSKAVPTEWVNVDDPRFPPGHKAITSRDHPGEKGWNFKVGELYPALPDALNRTRPAGVCP